MWIVPFRAVCVHTDGSVGDVGGSWRYGVNMVHLIRPKLHLLYRLSEKGEPVEKYCTAVRGVEGASRG